jgi:hypothetical protein
LKTTLDVRCLLSVVCSLSAALSIITVPAMKASSREKEQDGRHKNG